MRSIGTSGIWSDAEIGDFFGDLKELRATLRTGSPLTFPGRDGGFVGATAALASAALGSGFVTPLLCGDELVGVLFLTSAQAPEGDEDWVSLAVSASAQIALGIGLARAFAAQDSATRRTQESEALLRSITESAAEGIVVADARGKFVYWNPAAEAIMRMGSADTPPDEWSAHYGLFLPDRTTPFPTLELPLVRAIHGESVTHVQMFVRHATAPRGIWLSMNAQPLLSADGQRHGGVAVFRDVTAERATQEQLMISDRMASVGTLAAGVAHEINNPLASVIANLHRAALKVNALAKTLESSPELSKLQEELRDASECADRIRHIIRDLKIFSRSEVEKTGSVDVQRVLESKVRMASNEIRHRARLVKNYRHTGSVEASESRLGQVFLNLIVNAAQAIPEGRADSNEITISTTTQDDGRIVIEVADTGPGIPPDVLAQLFTPFFTTKPIGVGTGLGLSICRGIIIGFGGSIDVKSVVGQGTVFRVALLPANSEGTGESPAALAAAVPRRRGRILVVDDEPMIAKVVQRILSRDHEVVTVESAPLALQRITDGEGFDVILCDLMMPQMTGMEFHAALVGVDGEQAARVIFLTGGAFTLRAQEFLDEVPNLRIEKPFEPAQLRALINDRVRSREEVG